jgi:hypothetical protein
MGCYDYSNTKCPANGACYAPGHCSKHFPDMILVSLYGNPESKIKIRTLRLRGEFRMGM